MAAPQVDRCANPNCNAIFKRLGKGKLALFPVTDPVAWGLPEHVKQKALWLCEHCAASMDVRLDHRRHTIRVLRKPGANAA